MFIGESAMNVDVGWPAACTCPGLHTDSTFRKCQALAERSFVSFF